MLLVIGDSNADGAARAPLFPRVGDDAPLEDFRWSSGGAGVNVATAFARLGGRARLVSRTGTDATATIALAAAERSGVDLAFVERDPAQTTGVCIVLVSPGGERTFLSHRGANAALAPPSEGVWEGVRRLHVCGHALLRSTQRATTRALVAEAAARKLPVSLDLCLPLIAKYGSTLYRDFPSFDLVFMNEAELWRLAFGPHYPAQPEDFDEAVGRIFEGTDVETPSPGGPTPRLVVKRGALGSVMASPALGARDRPERGSRHLVSKQVFAPFEVTAVDSTAAGDAFVAAFLLAALAGKLPEQCARLANAAGAYQASHPGSADALPTRTDLAAFLAARCPPHELAGLL